MYYLFYIPSETEPVYAAPPWGTIALAGANLGAFLYFNFTPGSSADFYRFAAVSGAALRATRSNLVVFHTGWLHLLSNSSTSAFSPSGRIAHGTPRFLAAYLCFAGLANLAQPAGCGPYAGSPRWPILGASGAVAGVMGLFSCGCTSRG